MKKTAIGERLRRANPVPAEAPGAPDEGLLQRILQESRGRSARTHRSRTRSRLAPLFAVAALVVGGVAAGTSSFPVDYFGSDDAEPTPTEVVARLREFAPGGDVANLDEERFVRVAAFPTPRGRVTLYIAPAYESGHCAVAAVGPNLQAGGCGPGPDGRRPIASSGFWASGYGDVFPLYGRLPAEATRVELRFEDGRSRAASLREPWWAYIVGGAEVTPGHRPTTLVARDRDGDVVARQKLDPSTFTSKEAAFAALPKSNGSPGQDAVRARLETMWPFGMASAQEVDLSRTRLIKRFQTPDGPFRVYGAPLAGDGLCIGYVGTGFARDPHTGGCSFRDRTEQAPTPFASTPPLVSPLARYVHSIFGPTPPGAARLEVRFEDGAVEAVPVVYRSSFITWVGPERLVPGHRPTELVALSKSGRVVDRTQLESDQFQPCQTQACREGAP